MEALNRLYVLLVLWTIISVCGIHATADYARAQHEILDENVIQKWRDYEAFSHGLQGTVRVQRTRNGKTQESILQFKQNRECALAIYPHTREPSLLVCSLGNPHYLATLDLSRSDSRNAVLKDFTPLPGEIETVSPFSFVFRHGSKDAPFR